MKRSMIATGAISTILLSFGIVLKYMHAPGASFLITIGLLAAGFIFMPLHFMVRVAEKQKTTDKLLLGISNLAWVSAIIGVLWRVQHWPGTVILFYSTPFILLVLYLPLYFFTGIRNPSLKLNTIMYSVLIVISCGLFFTLTATPASMRLQSIAATKAYLRNERILANEHELRSSQTNNTTIAATGDKLYMACEELKRLIVQHETGSATIPDNFENGEHYIADEHSVSQGYLSGPMSGKVNQLLGIIGQYNTENSTHPITVVHELTDPGHTSVKYKVISMLNDLVQMQLVVLQNQRRPV